MIENTSVKHNRLIKNLSDPLHNLDITYFCYQYVSNDGHWFTFGNHPDWLFHCGEHDFFQYDPTLIKPKFYDNSSVCFTKYHQNDSFQESYIEQGINLFEIDNIIAVIEPRVHGCEYFFFGAHRNHVNVFNTYLKFLPILKYDYVRYFSEGIRSIREQCLNNSVNLSEINPDGFNSQENRFLVGANIKREIDFLSLIKDKESTISKAQLESAQREEFSSLSSAVTPPHSKLLSSYLSLTKREKDCIKLLQLGMTSKMMAKELHLSARTIEYYIENIKLKFDILSKYELTALLNTHRF